MVHLGFTAISPIQRSRVLRTVVGPGMELARRDAAGIDPTAEEREQAMHTWTTPVFVEIKMDAEIGSYQEDTELPVRNETELQPHVRAVSDPDTRS
jgi:hypothetical protein